MTTSARPILPPFSFPSSSSPTSTSAQHPHTRLHPQQSTTISVPHRTEHNEKYSHHSPLSNVIISSSTQTASTTNITISPNAHLDAQQQRNTQPQPVKGAGDARPSRPRLVTQKSGSSPSSPTRPKPRRSVLSKSSSAVPTLSTLSIPRAAASAVPADLRRPPTASGGNMTTANGASTAADLLRQAMMQR